MIDNSPVEYACAYIDRAVDEIESVREIADKLRKWGNEMYDNWQDSLQELEEQEELCDELREKIGDMEDKISELEDYIKHLEYEMKQK